MGLLSMLRSSAAAASQASAEPAADTATRPFNPAKNPYKAKRQWPPDLTKMTYQQQFAFEKRYKRRAKYSYLRPGWIRKVKLTQLVVVTGVAGYMIFFAELPEGDPYPLDELRAWSKRTFGAIFGVNSPGQPNLGRIGSRPSSDG